MTKNADKDKIRTGVGLQLKWILSGGKLLFIQFGYKEF